MMLVNHVFVLVIAEIEKGYLSFQRRVFVAVVFHQHLVEWNDRSMKTCCHYP